MKKVVTRIAPSPTGYFHVGSLRTALYNYLFAKNQGGNFLLRIEDTDRERFVEGGIENFINTLDWAGLTPDEGPYLENGDIKERGENGPYIQSNRLDIYRPYVDQLVENGHAYQCFCSKERLDELREMQQLNKKPTGYDGLCKRLSEDDVMSKLEAGEKYVVRMNVPEEGETTFTDLVRGEITIANSQIDDQVLVKTDGFPTYHMAVVVDDHLMEVTHISRGDEWLPSTPKHVMLYKMLGWEAPIFAHQPLLINEQKQKLSKRHGDVSVEDFVNKGYLLEALINFIAFLGWNPGDEREIFSMEELIKEFSFEKMSKSPAVFNREKLAWYNKQYLMSLPVEEVVKRAMPFFEKAGMSDLDQSLLTEAVELERGRVEVLSELPEAVEYFFTLPEYDVELVVWKNATKEESKKVLEELKDLLGGYEGDWNLEKISELVKEFITEKGYGNGDVLSPMRTSLAGKQNSPNPFELANAFGKEESLRRIGVAIERLS